jgi:CDP-diacylglycerol--glycerol-3-phosphate 3-phosphatidyltransferase
MASIYDLKPKFQGLLRPLVRSLAKGGVTANQVTIVAAALSGATGAALLRFPTERWALLAVPVVLFLRMALNAIDGMLAREHNQKSRLGAVLNELGDVLADAALYLPFAAVPGLPSPLIVMVVVLAIIGEMAGVVAIQVGAERRYDGPMGKSDRAFAFGLLALLLGAGLQPGSWCTLFLAAVAILAMLTILNRCRRALAKGGR